MGFLLLALLAIFLFASMLFAAKALPNFGKFYLIETISLRVKARP